ncbi:MAG: amidohydrolase family protein [Aromatoleum sp.]|nr:amidohydrolase family protein [Aromatoleum sp.]
MKPPAPHSLRVDAHHHVWQLRRGDYGWLTPDLALIHRDFSLDDLRPQLALAQIGATVLVQAAPTVAETEFLLAVARGSGGLVRGVVGWADFAAPDAIPTLARLARDPLLKSVRPMLQDLPDERWLLRAEVARTLAALPRLGLRFDALVKLRELPALLETLARFPELAVVVDHGAKPDIAASAWEPWASMIAEVATHPKARCKLSGLITEAGPAWTIDTLRRYVDHLLTCFGPLRLMWGSDWPVVELGGGYRRWLAATVALLAPLDAADRAAILGGTAQRFYGLE